MKERMTLSLLAAGQQGQVAALGHSVEMNRRFRDVGLIEGTLVECLYHSPWGSPVAYGIRGAVIALRTEDAARVSIVPVTREG